jgi:pimeloyl-ACP methyl ester carboxylesterase
MIHLARCFAGARRLVFVPELELRHQTFVWSDIEALRGAVLALQRGGRSVGMLGLSYGGSFGLIAAEDPGVASRLSFIGAFGSYVELLDVIQGITTGATIADGRPVPWQAAPEARAILARGAVELTEPGEREALARALADHDPDGLTAGGRATFDLVENTDPRRTEALAKRLPEPMRATIARFSPRTRIGSLKVPLFILQSAEDPATPPTEARLMHEAVPGSRMVLLSHFKHVRPGRGSAIVGQLRDLWHAWAFTTWVLAAQE